MIATILISLVLIAILTRIIVNMIKARKRGKPSCSCDCASCGGICPKFTEQFPTRQAQHKS